MGSIVALTVPILAVAFMSYQWAARCGLGCDVVTYYAAAERLNAGGELYALRPTDRPILLKPPYWNHPTIQSPLVAVLWRPVAAALPLNVAGLGWLGINAAALFWGIWQMLRRHGLAGAALVLILADSLGATIATGNMNGTLVALLILAHERSSGRLIALAAGLKLAPGILGLWLVGRREWSELRRVLILGLALLGLTVLGAGPDAILDYPAVVASVAPDPASPAAVLGVPWWLLYSAAGLAVLMLARRWPAAAWAIGVATASLGVPSIGPVSATLLLGALPSELSRRPEGKRGGVSVPRTLRTSDRSLPSREHSGANADSD